MRIRTFLNEWYPLPGSPPDEFDCVVDRVVSVLYRGTSVSEVQDLIAAEFADHIGLPVTRDDAQVVSERILAWWRSSKHGDPHA